MINLKALITESKNTKLHFRNVLPGGIEADEDVLFSVNAYNGRITLLPKSNKELDKLDRLGFSNRDSLGDLIAVILNRPLKDVELKYDDSYPGAGFGFIVDLEKLVKKL